ncbi:MAG: rhodanese-like domain-containing protein [Desulfobacteraceae bacterium]
MKKVCVLLLVFLFAAAGFAVAGDGEMLRNNEKKAWEKATSVYPAERQLNTEQFKKLYDRVMAGQEDAYLVDLRTHPEFYAGHIAGTDHIHAGHMYTFPKKIEKKDAKIVLWCRTKKRGAYVGERLVQLGYTNVWWYKEGIVGWINAGYPLCNQFMGLFKVTEYHKYFTGEYKEGKKKGQEKDPFRIREFHPY